MARRIDLCPDKLYLRLTGKRPEQLMNVFRRASAMEAPKKNRSSCLSQAFTDRCEKLFVNFLGSVPAPTHFQQDPPSIIFRSTIGPGVTTDISTRS